MGRATGVLVPARFLLTVGHFITIVLAFYSVRANVGASFSGHSSPTSSAVSAAEASLNAALSLSIICLAVCFTGLFAGYTLMFDRLNFLHCVLQFFGGVLMAWYLLDLWSYTSAWWIWGLFSLPSALLEGIAWMSIFVCKIYRY